jgi:hypothetical protein
MAREGHAATYGRFTRGKQRWSNFDAYGWTVRCSCGWSLRHNGTKAEARAYHREHIRLSTTTEDNADGE